MPFDKATLDALRTSGGFGVDKENPIYMTSGVLDVVDDALPGLIFEFMTFNNWDPDWDSSDLHEVGVIDFDGTDIMFKIDPVDPSKDLFSVTFLLPEEW
jgi:hypothetical protein